MAAPSKRSLTTGLLPQGSLVNSLFWAARRSPAESLSFTGFHGNYHQTLKGAKAKETDGWLRHQDMTSSREPGHFLISADSPDLIIDLALGIRQTVDGQNPAPGNHEKPLFVGIYVGESNPNFQGL